MPFVIEVDPVAFTLLGFPVRWYGLILVVAGAIVIWVGLREARRRGIEPGVVWDAVIWIGAASPRPVTLAPTRLTFLHADDTGPESRVRAAPSRGRSELHPWMV